MDLHTEQPQLEWHAATNVRMPFKPWSLRLGANGSASLRKTGCQGILLRGEVLFIEVDAKALNPLTAIPELRPRRTGTRRPCSTRAILITHHTLAVMRSFFPQLRLSEDLRLGMPKERLRCDDVRRRPF
jgi:hypothetical protein